MAGYNATSSTTLSVIPGAATLLTQSALSYVTGDRVSLVYALDASVNMQGEVLAYNSVTGAMLVDIDTISGIYSLQPVFNTQPWGETSTVFSSWLLSLIGVPSAASASTVPTIIVRALDQNWDPQCGQGLQNFIADIDAVAQILATRLKFLEGEWFENTADGTPLFQSLLGRPTTVQAVQLILRQRILGTPYVTGINSFFVNQTGRVFTFSATVQTQFGPITVSNG